MANSEKKGQGKFLVVLACDTEGNGYSKLEASYATGSFSGSSRGHFLDKTKNPDTIALFPE